MLFYSKRLLRLTCCLLLPALLLPGCTSYKSRLPSGSPKSVLRASTSRSEADLRRSAGGYAHYSMGVIHELNERKDEALKAYQQAVEADPRNVDMLLDISRRFIRQKQPEKALELLTRAADLPDASGDVFSQMAFVYGQLGRVEESTEASRKAIEKSPEELSGYQNLFLNYLQSKAPDKALATLDRALAIPEARFDFLVSIAELYMNLSLQSPAHKEVARKQALAALDRAEKLETSNVLMRLKLAEGFHLLGQSKRSTAIYSEALKEFADSPALRDRVRARLAEIYLQGSDREQARRHLEEIVKEDPTNAEAQYVLGNIAYELKDFEAASDYLTRALVLKPDFEQPYYDLAAAQLALNQPAEALSTLEKARARFDQSFVLEYLTAMAYNAQDSYNKALDHFTAAEVIGKATAPKRLNEMFYFQVAAARERNGEYEQAEKIFEQVLQMAPSFAEAQNYLGYMWADQGRNLERARELIEKAVKAEPDNAAFLDSLAWVLFKLGLPEEALPHALKALELEKEPDATLHDHLGDIYKATGESEKALEAWKKSLEIKEDESIRKKVEKATSGGEK